MNLKAIRAKVVRKGRKGAKVLGFSTQGPTEVRHGMPEGARKIDPNRMKEATPSRPVLPKPHPLLAAPQIGYRETWVKECERLKIYGPTVSAVDEEDQLLADVSVEWGRKAEDNWTFRRFTLPPPKLISGKTIVLASTGGDTYFHWMTDVLPRVRLIEISGAKLSTFDHVLVSGLDQAFQKETVQKLGLLPERCLSLSGGSHQALFLETAVLPSLPGVPGVVPPETVEFLQGVFLPQKNTPPKKIFVGRGDAKHRPLAHEKEILARLQKRGFEHVDCGKLSVQAQADIFGSAEIVLGAHGAALTNLVFCRPGTQVIELFGPGYVNPCYRDLCVAAGLRHAAVVGNGKDWVVSEKHDRPSAPITASWELLQKVLEELKS